jgi:hypothetical protein
MYLPVVSNWPGSMRSVSLMDLSFHKLKRNCAAKTKPRDMCANQGSRVDSTGQIAPGRERLNAQL